MALGSRGDVMAEKAASLERVTVEPTPAVEETARCRRRYCPLDRVLILLTLAACCLCLGFVELHRLRQGAEMQRQLLQLQLRLERLEGETPEGARLDKTPAGDDGEKTLSRSRRSVAEALRTVDGVPILVGPYGGSRRPTPSRGLSLYETLQSQRDPLPTVASARAPVDDPSIQPHHRSSAAHQPTLGRVNTNAVSSTSAQGQPEGAASGPAGGRVAPPGMLHRRSRAAPVLEARGSPTSFVPPSMGVVRTPGHRGGQKHQPVSCPAAHFEGHVAPLSRKTSSYGGNGRLKNTNPDALFADWQPAAWMARQRCEENFRLYGGQVTVDSPGLYYLYAQINYAEDNDLNAFEIQVNAQTLAKCITMEASDFEDKINTCHTGAVTYLGSGDAVSIRDLDQGRISILLPDRSFFGLVRLSG